MAQKSQKSVSIEKFLKIDRKEIQFAIEGTKHQR